MTKRPFLLPTAERLSRYTRLLHTNRLWHACPLDLECWWNYFRFAAPLRIYGPDRKQWITVCSNQRRSDRMWEPIDPDEIEIADNLRIIHTTDGNDEDHST